MVTDPEKRLKFDDIRRHKWFLGEKLDGKRDKIVKVEGLNEVEDDDDDHDDDNGNKSDLNNKNDKQKNSRYS